MKEEIDAINRKCTWTLVDRPIDKNVVGTKWVFKTKYKADSSIDKYKARLVSKGYAQKQGIDYDQTFAPFARMTTIRMVTSLAAMNGWKMHQLDVKIAFLNGKLKEEVYVE